MLSIGLQLTTNCPQLAVCITTIAMQEEEKKKHTTDGRGITAFIPEKVAGRLFKRVIGYTYHQIVWEWVKIPTTIMDSEKVANTVATFLNKDSDEGLFKRAIGYSYQQVVLECVRVPTTKVHSEKVDNTVTTFLNQ